MKKTIAILLILVIGMVGVFAADTSKVTLTTTIFSINEMVITAPTATAAGWTEYADLSAAVSSFTDYDGSVTVDAFDSTDTQPVGKLWTRSNNRVGYTVTIKADPLKPTGVDNPNTEQIDYVVSGGELPEVGYSTATPPTADADKIYLSQDATAGLHEKSAVIYVKFNSSSAGVSADTYEGDITFTFTSNS